MTPRKPANLPASYRPGVLASVNQRNRLGRMATATLGALVQDLGGVESLSTQQLMLAERATWLHLRLREMEEAFATGGKLNAAEYAALINAQSATLNRLGIARRARNAPSLRDYLSAAAPGGDARPEDSKPVGSSQP